jgi:hypothetical protein
MFLYEINKQKITFYIIPPAKNASLCEITASPLAPTTNKNAAHADAQTA